MFSRGVALRLFFHSTRAIKFLIPSTCFSTNVLSDLPRDIDSINFLQWIDRKHNAKREISK